MPVMLLSLPDADRVPLGLATLFVLVDGLKKLSILAMFLMLADGVTKPDNGPLDDGDSVPAMANTKVCDKT